jgi:hypothetical protein
MVLPELDKKDSNIKSIAQRAFHNEELLSDILHGILSKKDVVRSNCFKILLLLSEEKPEFLYPQWDYFVDLLRSDNTYHRHIGIYIIAQLTRADTENRFEKIFDMYYSLLDDESVIPAAHLALNSGKIVRAKPGLQSEITARLLRIDETHHTPERKDLIKGYAIEAFDEYFEEASDKQKILQFVADQLESKSPTTKKKANQFMRKWRK